MVHNRNTYQREGCRCEVCTSAQREYVAAQRERRRLRVAAAMPVDEPADSPESGNSPGRVESGVLAELELLGVRGRPGLAAGAVSMARILDNPLAVGSQPAACRQLMALLGELHKCAVPRHGRLAAVQKMTQHPDAG